MPRENLHVTVKFLGSVGEERVETIASASATAAARVPAFECTLTSFGAFPTARRARVVWIGIDDPARGFASLAESVEDEMSPLGFEREGRPFTPHLTVARLGVPAALTLPGTQVGAAFRVEHLTLFRSRLRSPAPEYTAVGEFPLSSR